MVQYGETVQLVNNPRDTTINRFLEILENTEGAIDIKELCKSTCKRDFQVAAYLGNNWSLSNNWKLREVVKFLVNNNKVKQVSSKPLTLQWLCEIYEVYDAAEINENRC
jgi:ABC-type uncharacterized transport system ATPase subunit